MRDITERMRQGPAGKRVRAETLVYHGESWRDGGPAVIVDYSPSRLFRNVRDEMREVSPGLYLGLTWVTKRSGPELAMMFTLQDPAVMP